MRIAAPLTNPLLVGLLSACGAEATPAVRRPDSFPAAVAAEVAVPDSAALREGRRALTRYLDASRESTPDAAAVASLTDCGEDGQSFFPSSLLAGYTVLNLDGLGDTLVGRAEVVTVAEQDVDRRQPNQFVARQRVRADVLEWDVIRNDDGGWSVCNGLRFGYRGADSLTTWRPEGASYASAKRLADSVAAVRR